MAHERISCYATVAQVKAKLNITTATQDTEVLDILKAASRDVDFIAGRHFYTTGSEARYFDGPEHQRLILDDALSVSALATDSEIDGTFDGESWTEDTDYALDPPNRFPKTRADALSYGNFSFAHRPKYVKVTGVWGHGDGSTDPWLQETGTATVASVTGTTLTLSVADDVVAGQTIKVALEQMLVESCSSKSATVTRGINATTPVAHSTATTLYSAKYPWQVRQATVWFSVWHWREAASAGYANEKIGQYQYQLAPATLVPAKKSAMLAGLTRHHAG